MGGSVSKAVKSVVAAQSNVLAKATGIQLVDEAARATESQAATSQGTAQTVSTQSGAQQASIAGAGEEAQVARGSGARNTDPRRARAKFRTPTVAGGGAQNKPGVSIGI